MPPRSSEAAVASGAVEVKMGSEASYAESSEARLVGTVGASGVVGAEKTLTEPTCASLACKEL